LGRTELEPGKIEPSSGKEKPILGNANQLPANEAVLPVEIDLQSLRVTRHGSLSAKEYHELMMDKINNVHESRFKALEEIEKAKIKIAKVYNKHVTP
jgi:hypothetical protein